MTRSPSARPSESELLKGKYMLNASGTPVVATDWMTWLHWMCDEAPEWTTEIRPSGVRVLTYFCGQRNEDGTFYTTQVSGGRYNGRSANAASRNDASAQHERVVAWLCDRLAGTPMRVQKKRSKARPQEHE